jgi:uncharacterized membrane protein YhaH (DUF805 family)
MEQMIARPSLSFTEALSKASNDIFKINGRSRRSEFWWTILVVYITNVFLTPFLGSILSLLTIPLKIRRLHDVGKSGWWWGVGAILQGAFLFMVIYEAIMTFAFHAHGGFEQRTFWMFVLKWLALWGIVLIYKFVLIVFYCMDSQPFTNKYGDSPKYAFQDPYQQGRA